MTLPIKERIILDLCGGTGSWSKPYKDAGYDVRLVTLPDHDVRTYEPPGSVYGILAAPPCTEFSFAKHFHGKGNYHHDFALGLEVVCACLMIIAEIRPDWWCLENPRGYVKRWLGKPQATFEPWQYGDNYQKRTDLWGRFNIPPRTTVRKPNGLKKFSLLKNSEIQPEYLEHLSRTERRAITPPGFAQAFHKANR